MTFLTCQCKLIMPHTNVSVWMGGWVDGWMNRCYIYIHIYIYIYIYMVCLNWALRTFINHRRSHDLISVLLLNSSTQEKMNLWSAGLAVTFKILRPEQNRPDIANGMFGMHLLEKYWSDFHWILFQRVQLVQVTDWHQKNNKPLSEPVITLHSYGCMT